MVCAVDEEVDESGQILREPDADTVNSSIRYLLDNSARMIVISLRRAHVNPHNEWHVRQIITESYPKHYLGAVPLLLSSQVTPYPDDAKRTAAAVLNAYFHRGLAQSLYRAEDSLRANGYTRPLLIVGADGGVTRVA